MEISGVTAAYFSATYSTRKVVDHIAGRLGAVRREIDVTCAEPAGQTLMGATELLVAGVPAYGGRVPSGAIAGLKSLKGDGTPVVLVCVYGNRDYDDALLELSDILRGNGFVPVAAAAVVAEHCIFPAVATGRPDKGDRELIEGFCARVREWLASAPSQGVAAAVQGELPLKGNRPYKKYGGLPIRPSAGKECDGCGACVAACPTKAIDAANPRDSIKGRCIACARCVNVCPKQARKFRGVLYKMTGKLFVKACAARREPEFMVI